MTEVSLKVNHEMILPDALKYTSYQTNNVINQIEEQTLEKAYVGYPGNSGDSTTLTFNLPSISGGSMYRNLDLEVPISWDVVYQNYNPEPLTIITAPTLGTDIPVGSNIWSMSNGSSVRAFLKEINCLDMFCLSKLFSNREYTINNSSTILKEEFSPEQIDCMVAQLNLTRVEDKQLCPFADANSHFQVLAHSCGGVLVPENCITSAGNFFNFIADSFVTAAPANVTEEAFVDEVLNIMRIDKKRCTGWEKSWYSTRNTGRNIINSAVTFTLPTTPSGLTVGLDPAYCNNLVPLAVNTNATLGNVTAVAYVGANDTTVSFSVTIREQLISQFWDNDYTFNRFSWNKLIPCSSLNVKLNVNQDYMKQGLLKIGDNTNAFVKYSVANMKIGQPSQCKLYVKQCKIPLALYPSESYKLLYYAQEKPQASKDMEISGNTFVAEMQYSNLSQISEYLFIYLPINKSAFLSKIYASNTNANAYQLPSTFNLPITSLRITFNQDTGLATHGLDAYTLQQYTLQNLQDDERLQALICGESQGAIGEFSASSTIKNTVVIANQAPTSQATRSNFYGLGRRELTKQLGTAYPWKYHYNGVSNSSFYILKMGTQIRLPEMYSPGTIVNFNMSIRAECDLSVDSNGVFTSPALRPNRDFHSDAKVLRDFLIAIPQAPAISSFAKLEVVHMNKRIMSLSGDALSNLYVHNVQITTAEYKNLLNQFESNFNRSEKSDVFSADMMIGGSFMSKLRDKASELLPKLKKAAEVGRAAVNVAKSSLGDDNRFVNMADEALRFVGHGMDPREIEAGKKRGRPSGSSKQAVDWRKYSQGI